MGVIAERHADRVILTNDNPRQENADDIISQIKAQMTSPEQVSILPDRATAIETAVSEAVGDDVILIAGKGHETTQEIDGERRPFSDRQMVRNLLETRQ